MLSHQNMNCQMIYNISISKTLSFIGTIIKPTKYEAIITPNLCNCFTLVNNWRENIMLPIFPMKHDTGAPNTQILHPPTNNSQYEKYDFWTK